MVQFERPVGAWADVAELEYVAAMHQTCTPELRRDGSIYAIDIVHFLSSRYGIRVSVEEVQETILKGLGGGDSEDECIDLTEIVAILFIPLLIKAADAFAAAEGPQEEKTRKDFRTEWQYKDYLRRKKISNARSLKEDIIKNVLDMILLDATGSTTPKKLDKALVKDIFAAYGERHLVDDDELIEEMISAASGGKHKDGDGSATCLLDSHALARALTADVRKYHVENESSVSTHYYDVFHTLLDKEKRPYL